MVGRDSGEKVVKEKGLLDPLNVVVELPFNKKY